MPVYTPTADQDIIQVSESWLETNKDSFMFSHMPHGFMPAKADGVDNVSYRIPAFSNSLLQAAGLHNWSPGMAQTRARTLGEETVSVQVGSRATDVIERPADRPVNHRYADLQANIVPLLLGQTYQGIDKDVATFLTTTANWTAATFTGTGDLDTFAADQKPLWDIRQQCIAPLRKYAKINAGFEIEWWMDNRVADILASHWNVFGASAAYSAVALQGGPMTHAHMELTRVIEQNLGIKVKIFAAVSDTVEMGQTSAPREISYGLCWVGVVDRRQSRWDITAAGVLKPDGAIQLAITKDPWVKTGIVPLSEVETFVGRAEYTAFSPRGSAWGYLIPVGEIIT